MASYYNEIDPYAAQWLRNLIAANLIAPGDVDERSIVDVRPDDLRGYTQCHFFAGIGGWSRALRLAGWDDARPVWTGSCPCQPFSTAGKRKGEADARHLWPDFRRLIAECGPAVVFGEQVASKDGRLWLARVRADLEALGYAVGAADLCAAGVGAPHIRQRLWWVADAAGERHDGVDALLRAEEAGRFSRNLPEAAGRGATGRMAEPISGERCGWSGHEAPGHRQSEQHASDSSGSGRLGHADEPGPQGRHDGPGESGRADQRAAGSAGQPGFWSRYEIIPCADGKARRIGPGIQPLAHGVSGRVGKLRAAGNAIVPQVGAAFIRAYLDVRAA